MPAKRALIMNPSDNVATAVEEIQPGMEVAIPMGQGFLFVRAVEAIPFGFKIALQDIAGERSSASTGRPSARPVSPSRKGRWSMSTTWKARAPRGNLERRDQ